MLKTPLEVQQVATQEVKGLREELERCHKVANPAFGVKHERDLSIDRLVKKAAAVALRNCPVFHLGGCKKGKAPMCSACITAYEILSVIESGL